VSNEFEQLIEAYKPIAIGGLLKSGSFVVPPNQRSYSWGPENWADLWDDLVDLAEGPEPSGNAFRDCHFLGPMFFVKIDQTEVLRILDGQQRISSLGIVLSLLGDIIRYFQFQSRLSPEGLDLPGRVTECLYLSIRGMSKARITLGRDNNAFYTKILSPIQFVSGSGMVPNQKVFTSS
jgi:hypothetical protein